MINAAGSPDPVLRRSRNGLWWVMKARDKRGGQKKRNADAHGASIMAENTTSG
jgi:hypothetical protein